MKHFWLGLLPKPQNRALAQIFCPQCLQMLELFVPGLSMKSSIFNQIIIFEKKKKYSCFIKKTKANEKSKLKKKYFV
jgi:hypothetical protein